MIKPIAILIFLFLPLIIKGQSWVTADDGLAGDQPLPLNGKSIQFYHDEVTNKDWIYGSFKDKDSIQRMAAFRDSGRWIPLNIEMTSAGICNLICRYADTLYFVGAFDILNGEIDTSSYGWQNTLKVRDDSIWAPSVRSVFGAKSAAVWGDTLIFQGGWYDSPTGPIGHQYVTYDGGLSWQYPFSPVHPTQTIGDFGPPYDIEIHNGLYYTLNNDSPSGSAFRGITMYDGTIWHSIGPGIVGSLGRGTNIEFYNGDLYFGGSFSLDESPNNPGNFIARWTGTQWEGLANGTNGFCSDLQVHDSRLWMLQSGTQFGDINIGYIGAWDGQQWCGTPFTTTVFPESFGFVNDSLYMAFKYRPVINGDTMGYIVRYDGDFISDGICSTLGLGMEEQEEETLLYPNPVSNRLRVEGANSSKYQVYDLLGRPVLQGVILDEIDVSELPSGTYILRIGNESRRFVKQ